MALEPNIAVTTLFGPSVEITGSNPDTTIKIKLSELGVTGDTSTLSGEGIVLALLQHLDKVQGTAVNRVLEVRNNPIFATKGGDPCIGQMSTLRIFSTVPITDITPGQV